MTLYKSEKSRHLCGTNGDNKTDTDGIVEGITSSTNIDKTKIFQLFKIVILNSELIKHEYVNNTRMLFKFLNSKQVVRSKQYFLGAAGRLSLYILYINKDHTLK